MSRRLVWDVGGITEAIAGRRAVSPYRAAQLSELLGEDQIKYALLALEAQARTEDEKQYWQTLQADGTANTIEIRELVEAELGPKYVFVVASALQRANISTKRAIAAALPKAKQFFDAWPNVFESGKSKIDIGSRRQLMADFLSGDEEKAAATAKRWNSLNLS